MNKNVMTRTGICRQVFNFGDGGYATMGDCEDWESVVAGARQVEHVESAIRWNSDWEDVYKVFGPDIDIKYYYVRTIPDAPEIPLPKLRSPESRGVW